MKINKLLFVLASTALLGMSKDGDELQTLDEVIASSERQLMTCKELRSLIAKFQEQQELFYQGQQTKELASQMIETASEILHLAKSRELMYLFSPFFIEELHLFSGLVKKKQALK